MGRPAAGLLIKAASVWIVEHVGTRMSRMYHTASIKKFRASHVKKAISPKQSTDRGGRAPKHQATKATSLKPQKRQASSLSVKRLAKRSVKHQAINVGPIVKRQAWRFAVVVYKT